MSRPLRVLHFADIINRGDFIDNIVRNLHRERFSPLVATFVADSNVARPEYDAIELPHIVLDVRPRKLDYLLAAVKLRKVLREENVGLVHAHHYYPSIIAVLAARITGGVPIVVGRHYHDEVHRISPRLKRRLLLSAENWVIRRADTVVVPTRTIERFLVEEQGVVSRNIRIVPYGFDFERYIVDPAIAVALRRELGLDGQFVIGNFARHHPLKGQIELINAFARLAREDENVRLVMVGDGDYRMALEKARDRHELGGRVVFLGWRRDALALMSAVDVVAHPTFVEAFPQVMIEALAVERPLVIGRVSGAVETITDGTNGLLVASGDTDALYRALRWLREHPEEAREMGRRGSKDVRRQLDIRTIVEMYENIYENLALV